MVKSSKATRTKPISCLEEKTSCRRFIHTCSTAILPRCPIKICDLVSFFEVRPKMEVRTWRHQILYCPVSVGQAVGASPRPWGPRCGSPGELPLLETCTNDINTILWARLQIRAEQYNEIRSYRAPVYTLCAQGRFICVPVIHAQSNSECFTDHRTEVNKHQRVDWNKNKKGSKKIESSIEKQWKNSQVILANKNI